MRRGSAYMLQLADDALDSALFEAGGRRAQDRVAAGNLAGALAELDSCLELWRDRPLSGLPGPFAEAERTRLAEIRLRMIEQRAEVLLGLRRHREVVADLGPVILAEPLRERLRGLLMLALYRCGRQAEALAEFERERRLLDEELGIDPGLELRDLQIKILRADPGLDPDHEDLVSSDLASGRAADEEHGVGDSRGTVPAQLPHGVAGFMGRSAELDLLGRWATSVDADSSSSAVVITAIDGAGGIGKTALAIQFAHEVRDQFPDGQLYVQLRGFDPSLPPLSTDEALGQLLRALGVSSTRIPVDVVEQAGLYRSRLAGKRMLIVLDNAKTADQVRDLLPPARPDVW